MKEKIKNIFIQGPISPEFIAKSIEAHQLKKTIGAHNIFLGQVREDLIGGKKVNAIEFTAQEDMANKVCHDIKENTFKKYDIHCMHIYHSLGIVKTGEVCIFVFVSAGHRDTVFNALHSVVDNVKEKAPIFGKEILEDHTHNWKVNK